MSEKNTQLAPLSMGQRGIQLTNIESAYRFAKCVILSGDVPRCFNTPEKILIAIQRGAELGMSPLQSIESFAPINGRFTLWGDALPALVQASGKCEYYKEKLDGTGDQMCAVCESKRKDQSEPLITRFGVADAKRANLWGKKGPWSDYPQRMLKLRARTYNFRDNFADALRGIQVYEEVADYAGHAPEPSTATAIEAEYSDPLLEAAVGKPQGTEANTAQADTAAEDAEYASGEPTPEEIEAIRREEAEMF